MRTTLIVSMDWLGKRQRVGEMNVFEKGGKEYYRFSYSKEWIKAGFAIDPELPLSGIPYHSSRLWGAFQDISPDRWGRLIQDRAYGGHLTEADSMLGVSDRMRMGALRLGEQNTPDVFLAKDTKLPTLASLRELEEASRRLEKGIETEADIQLLLEPGSSLGGAHPKAAIEDNGHLYIAKFQSRMSTVRSSSWEATMLDIGKAAGLNTANHRLLNENSESPVLLVERFDRRNSERLPYSSAMTLMNLRDTSPDGGSYAELADVIRTVSSQPKIDQYELWRRMLFNAVTGNTDDHLRNHGFIRDRQGWSLSPAFDLNPTSIQYEKRKHALSFDGVTSKPSLETCKELAPFFDVDGRMVDFATKKTGQALKSWKDIATKNKLGAEEIKRMESAFNHEDSERLISMRGED